jgi:very-short-patch-repair endonuclease
MMRDDIPISAKSRARAMRRALTDAERKLWYALRDRRMQSLKFRRQAPVGPYIVDFLCLAHKLVVEADGSQHAENRRDAARDAWLAREGYKVLRFGNRDILTTQESVLATITAACGLPWRRKPSPQPLSRKRERGARPFSRLREKVARSAG